MPTHAIRELIDFRPRLEWHAAVAALALLSFGPLTFSLNGEAAATRNCVTKKIASRLAAVESSEISGSGPKISLDELSTEIAARRARVNEFQFIREEAQRRGLRVWLSGGTAAAYSHYVKWDLLREAGDTRFQANRFDYDYTHIFRSTQDLDLVIDGGDLQAQAFQRAIKERFPYFMGTKSAAWEVRSLTESHGDKGALLGDFGFMNQHTDFNSTGMVELTEPPKGESVVRDIKDWKNTKDPAFLKDVAAGKITYFHSPTHTKTPLYLSGHNPTIFSVIRALTKAFQYDLEISPKDLALFQAEAKRFNPKRDLPDQIASDWVERNGKKLFQNAVDVERAWNTLEKIGLRQKLISVAKNPDETYSLAWWMSKEPLRSKPVGLGNGKTAESLGIKTIAHETSDFQAYESITRSPVGGPSIFVSRSEKEGEAALYGEGLYTAIGSKGARGSGVTVRFELNPKAREGSDFDVIRGTGVEEGFQDYLVVHNKNAIRVIPESLNLSPSEYFEFLAQGKQFSEDDGALLWQFRRKIENASVSGQIPKDELAKIRATVLSQFKKESVNRDQILAEWLALEAARLKKDPAFADRIAEELASKSYRVDPARTFSQLLDFSRGTDLEKFVSEKILGTVIKTLKSDLGDRALEGSLFSGSEELRRFADQALKERESRSPSPFLSALRGIQKMKGDAIAWLKAPGKSSDLPKEKAAYLALHPELRAELGASQFRPIERIFRETSNIELFEKLAADRLPPEARSESFEFKSFEFPKEGKRVSLGSRESDLERRSEEDLHEVTFKKPFEIQKTPVTQLQWSLVMDRNPSHFAFDGEQVRIGKKTIAMRINHPVESVKRSDIRKFLQKLNELDPNYEYRLATEAEWEYAARGDTVTPHPFGKDDRSLNEYAWSRDNSNHETHAVASLKPNQNGLYDMSGNVNELVQDRWSDGRPEHAVDPVGPARGSGAVSRGGSFSDAKVWQRPAVRVRQEFDEPNESLGFRLVRVRK